jgi:hypothetical protein
MPLLHKVIVRCKLAHVYECDAQMWRNSIEILKPAAITTLNEHAFPFTVIINLLKNTLERSVEIIKHIHLFLPGLLAGNRVHGNCRRCTCM